MPLQTKHASCMVEPLESRTLLAADVFAAHSNVKGERLQDWTAQWWQKVFSIPVYASDGTTIINPQFDEPLNPGETVNTNHALPSNDGKIFFLFGSFFGGEINRTVTVPTGTPLLVPILNFEWSNPDTPAAPDFMTLPGNHSAATLAHFADVQTHAVTSLSATLDGDAVPNMFSHREISPTFTYVLPPNFNIDQVFFGEDISGPQTPAVSDGYWLMLKPLSKGQHVLNFTGESADLSGTPPQLGAFSVDTTYTINVLPNGQFKHQNSRNARQNQEAKFNHGKFGDTHIKSHDHGKRDRLIDNIEALT